MGTYLGSRFFKFAVRVNHHSLFLLSIITNVCMPGHFPESAQSKPFGDIWETAEANDTNLLHELKMLHIGQYFLSSFISRAAENDVQLPHEYLCSVVDSVLMALWTYNSTLQVHF
jgi:hypothetical protein